MRGTPTEQKLIRAAHEEARKRVEAWSGTKPPERDVLGFFFGGMVAKRIAGALARTGAKAGAVAKKRALTLGKAAKRKAAMAKRGALRTGTKTATKAAKPPGLFKQSLYGAGAFTAVDYTMRKMLGDADGPQMPDEAGYGDQREQELEEAEARAAATPRAPKMDYKGLAGSRMRLSEMVGPIKYPIA